MTPNPLLCIHPPLLNSASPWSTSPSELLALHSSPHTGAITTRTSTLLGGSHDGARHKHAFFDARTSQPMHARSPNANSSLNTLNYSPHALAEYLSWLPDLFAHSPYPSKPVIVSVACSPAEIPTVVRLLSAARGNLPASAAVLLELNLSCPNITGTTPPAYDAAQLKEHVAALDAALQGSTLHAGIKVSPFTYAAQFDALIAALLSPSKSSPHSLNHASPPTPPSCQEQKSRISFITATNTLGSALLLNDLTATPDFAPPGYAAGGFDPALPGVDGTGGLGGVALHPLALGNVRTLRRRLDAEGYLQEIAVVGVGGVSDYGGFERMRAVGAAAVGLATALGREGPGVFGRICGEVEAGMRVFGNGINAKGEGKEGVVRQGSGAG